ncbi:galacturonosyltransferase 8, partial [Tanacetum coccineum]
MAISGTSRTRHPLTFRQFTSTLSLTLILFVTLTFFFTSSHDVVSSIHNTRLGFALDTNETVSLRRSVLALKSDPLKPRFDQIRKQADDHRSLALAYAAYARKLKLENSKLVRIFADLSRNYTDLLTKPVYKALSESDASLIDEQTLRLFEKEVKERIKVTRQVIAEAKES